MSTRASIILKEGCTYANPIYLYHHCDGYVEGVGYILRRVMKFHPFCYVEQVATDLVRMEDKYGSGFRVSNVLPDDIEYVYVIDGDSKTVVSYKRQSWDDDVQEFMKWPHLTLYDCKESMGKVVLYGIGDHVKWRRHDKDWKEVLNTRYEVKGYDPVGKYVLELDGERFEADEDELYINDDLWKR